MRLVSFIAILMLIPGVSVGASRSSEARIGMSSRMPTMATSRVPNKVTNIDKTDVGSTGADDTGSDSGSGTGTGTGTGDTDNSAGGTSSASCRDAYRQCMDGFCLLDESEGNRCACSSNIEKSKPLILEIQRIQEEADKLYTEGVEREQLGAKAAYVFGSSARAQQSSRASGMSFSAWLQNNNASSSGDSLSEDDGIGDALYEMAAEACASELESCSKKADMEEKLYVRQIIQDCKGFESYLSEQKRNAEANKRTAEKAVRTARVSMLGETNKYNRGECLLAYKSCIADKGGCGANFENCLDEKLLGRRANACENILDQCLAVRADVLKDWKEEAQYTLEQAAIYSEKNSRLTCLARIQDCLEEGCSLDTNPQCLTNVEVAAGVCPVIDECNDKIPGIKEVVKDKLGYLRSKFCQTDLDKCLRDKCGQDFTDPACLGKNTDEITKLCPQSMFPSCKNETQFSILVQSNLLKMDYQMLQGCLNYFGEQLGKTCGTDMKCLTIDSEISSLTEIPAKQEELQALRQRIRDNSKTAVADFFKQFEKDKTIDACKSTEGVNLGDAVFNSAHLIAEINAEQRAMGELDAKIAELSRKQDVKKAEENCKNTYKPEDPKALDAAGKKNYSYIRSVSFEPSLRNCHVCRMQQTCETGGESKGTGFAKGAAGGMAAGASAGTMVTPGWGTAIGGVVGMIGGGLAGMGASGKKDLCQETESCEDINM